MKKGYKNQRLLSILLLVFMLANILAPNLALATSYRSEKVEAKPLVVLMEFADYKFSDIESKEEWRVREIPGKDYPEVVKDMLFSEDTYTEAGNEYISIRNFYKQMSGGTYDFNGEVVGPYTAEMNAKDYCKYQGDQDSPRILIEEAIKAVAADENIDLNDFDLDTRKRDRETYETHITYGTPDGQVDSIVVIHPGLGAEFGGGSLGNNAIWPFRRGFTWYGGEWGLKEYEVKDHKGKDWRFDDFAIIAQDSAADTLAHEFGHVLGLPDLYGFNGSTPPVSYWDIMGGSYTGKDINGTMPVGYGAYNRNLLQDSFEKGNANFAKWTNRDKRDFSQIGGDGLEIELHQAHERKDGKLDTFRIDLPEKETVVLEPAQGEKMYFSGAADDLRNSMVAKNIDLTDYEEVFLEFKTWYKIDPYFDFVTIRVNESGKEDEWKTVKGNITTEEFDDWLLENETEEQMKERNPGHGITDSSGGWIDAEFNLSEYAGKEIDLTFYFWTDSNTPMQGMYVDDIKITGIEKSEEPEEPEEPVEPTEPEEPIEPEIKENEIVVGEEKEIVLNEGDLGKDYILKLEEDMRIRIDTKGAKDIYWDLSQGEKRNIIYKGNDNFANVEEEKDARSWSSSDGVLKKGEYKLHVRHEKETYDKDFQVLVSDLSAKEIFVGKEETDLLRAYTTKKEYEFELEEDTTVEVRFKGHEMLYWDVSKVGDKEPLIWAGYNNHKEGGNESWSSHKFLKAGKYSFKVDWRAYTEGEDKFNKDGQEYSFIIQEPSNEPEPEKPLETETEKDPNKDWKMIFEDDAEGESKFELNGFIQTTGRSKHAHYYLLEWRNPQPGKVDEGLQHISKYNPNTQFDPGLLVWYINEHYIDDWNNPDQQVAEHPGYMFAGVVDADPKGVGYHYSDGNYYVDTRDDFNMHDAAFSLRQEQEFYHDWGGGTVTEDLDRDMVPVFDDSNDYSSPDYPQTGMILENYGLKILVLEESADSESAKIRIMNTNKENKEIEYKTGLRVKDLSLEDDGMCTLEVINDDLTKGLGESAFIGFRGKDENGKTIEFAEQLYLINGKYTNALNKLASYDGIDFEISYIILEDGQDNVRAIYNSKVHSGYGMDLSKYNINSDDVSKNEFTPEGKLNIKGISTKTKDGVDSKEFEKGNTVMVTAEIEEVRAVDEAMVIIEVLDSNDVPYALRYVPYKNNVNKYDLGLSTYEAKEGKNKVKVYVWNNLKDKKVLGEVKTLEFELK